MLLRPQGFQAVFEARRKKQKQKQESQAKAGHTHTQNFPLNDIKKEDEKQHLKDLSQHVHSLPFSLFFSFFFFARVAQLHAGEVNGCLSARREPPLICTECRSSTTAHTHTWRAARAFEGESRTSISKPECK